MYRADVFLLILYYSLNATKAFIEVYVTNKALRCDGNNLLSFVRTF